MRDASGKGNSKSKSNATIPITAETGNELFERAVEAIGLDRGTTRWLFVSVLNAIGTTPATLTPDELGNVLPTVDQRIRQLIQAKEADAAMARLFRVLFDQAEPT
jgi:hypothetical protein